MSGTRRRRTPAESSSALELPPERAELAVLASRAERSGVFLDFDGTLSEIAPTPEAATAVEGATEVLVALAERYALVALVSGRRAADVGERLGHPPRVRVFGLYGMERGERGAGLPISALHRIEELLPGVREAAVAVPGALVEPKGSNLAVHYRLASDPEAARLSLMEALGPLAEAAGLQVIEGKRVLELVPSGSPSKGDVIEREGAGLDAVLYAGDDLADLDAFAAADRLAAGGASVVKVAVRSAETPQALLDAADMVVRGPAGLIRLLRSLVR